MVWWFGGLVGSWFAGLALSAWVVCVCVCVVWWLVVWWFDSLALSVGAVGLGLVCWLRSVIWLEIGFVFGLSVWVSSYHA